MIDVVGDHFNPATGIFRVPQNGMYQFSVDGILKGSHMNDYWQVDVFVNDKAVKRFQSVVYSDSGVNGFVVLPLRKDDTVYLTVLDSTALYQQEMNLFTFMGILLL